MKILLIEDTAKAHPEVRGRTLLIYHKTYAPPVGPWEIVSFDAMKSSGRDWLQDRDTIVFVGLSRAINPGNRMDIIWEILFNKTVGIDKVSVDTHLFISEPWRAWFQFGFTGTRYRDYAHSFIGETQHNAHVDGMRADDPFSLDEVLRWCKGTVTSTYRRWFEPLEIQVREVPRKIKDGYAKLKEQCFAEEASPKRIVARLEDFAQKSCPDRIMPAPRSLWASRQARVVATDLAVDTWLVSRLEHLVTLTNGIAEACHAGNGRV